MTRRWLTSLPLALAVAGSVVLPATASADGPPTPTCTKDTQEVTDLTTVVTKLGTALQATPPDPTKLSQVAGDLFTAVGAAQTAGCLPALPSSPPTTTPPTPPPTTPPPTPPPTHPTHPQDVTKCAADTVALLSAALEEIKAGTATSPSSADLLTAATDLATAITAVNTDSCLPVTLPVPSIPAPPAPPIAPVP
jgi:hypothetical protein